MGASDGVCVGVVPLDRACSPAEKIWSGPGSIDTRLDGRGQDPLSLDRSRHFSFLATFKIRTISTSHLAVGSVAVESSD